MSENKDILTLIEKAQQGDSQAFGKLVQSHERFVYNVIYRMISNPEDAKDISQEVFIKAFKYIGKFDGKASFSTWLYRIAVNACIDELRKRKGKDTVSVEAQLELEENSVKMQFADESSNVEDKIIAKEGLTLIKEAMEKISQEHKTIIVLRDIEGLSYAEIAEITETSLGTVKSRLARARKALKEIIIEMREQNKTLLVRKT
ncbi:MAG: sigma-70 family RNA polymerase sigma factor [Anaerotignaceae bacterium]